MAQSTMLQVSSDLLKLLWPMLKQVPSNSNISSSSRSSDAHFYRYILWDDVISCVSCIMFYWVVMWNYSITPPLAPSCPPLCATLYPQYPFYYTRLPGGGSLRYDGQQDWGNQEATGWEWIGRKGTGIIYMVTNSLKRTSIQQSFFQYVSYYVLLFIISGGCDELQC